MLLQFQNNDLRRRYSRTGAGGIPPNERLTAIEIGVLDIVGVEPVTGIPGLRATPLTRVDRSYFDNDDGVQNEDTTNVTGVSNTPNASTSGNASQQTQGLSASEGPNASTSVNTSEQTSASVGPRNSSSSSLPSLPPVATPTRIPSLVTPRRTHRTLRLRHGNRQTPTQVGRDPSVIEVLSSPDDAHRAANQAGTDAARHGTPVGSPLDVTGELS